MIELQKLSDRYFITRDQDRFCFRHHDFDRFVSQIESYFAVTVSLGLFFVGTPVYLFFAGR